MLDFRVVIAACIAGIVILFGGFGLVASFKLAHEPLRPASRIVERPRVEPNASLPVVIETPAAKPAPALEVVRTPEPLPVPLPVIVPAPAPVVPPVAPPIEARAPEPAPIVPPIEARAPEPAPVVPSVEARAPAPALVQPAPVETTGAIAPKPARAIPAPAYPAPTRTAPATAALPTTVPVEHPQATADLPPSRPTARNTPRRPRPAAPRPAAPAPTSPTNPFSAIFGGFTNQ